jgi:hypothetical protein
MLNAGTLLFEEFAMREQLPLATIHDAVLEFLRGRDVAVMFGAQAVNAYVGEARMSQDIDLIYAGVSSELHSESHSFTRSAERHHQRIADYLDNVTVIHKREDSSAGEVLE